MTKPVRKKLIEVALPLEAINKASVREGYIYRGNPSALHKWWAQRPLAAARAVIFAQMVDDPSSWPDLFPTEKAQEKERQRLFKLIEDLVKWENTTNGALIQQARDEIWRSWRRACAENADHPHAATLFDREKLPSFHDPFAGGGTIPLEAQRLGFLTFASDLNPVAVLINKALIDIPLGFYGQEPVNPSWSQKSANERVLQDWKEYGGFADDVRYYGNWMQLEAEKSIGQLYPKVFITAEMAKDRTDLKPDIGKSLLVIGWIWARTVASPNPAFKDVFVPLASTFMVSTKLGKEIHAATIVVGSSYSFSIKQGRSDAAKSGTKTGPDGSFQCLLSGAPITFDYIRTQAASGSMGTRLIAAVAIGTCGRVYLAPSEALEGSANVEKPIWSPDIEFFASALGFRVANYGMTLWSDLFTNRQLAALNCFHNLLPRVRAKVIDDGGSVDYAQAIMLLLCMAIDKHAMYGNTLVPWYSKEDRPSMLFGQQVVQMVWDFVEVNPLSTIGGSFSKSVEVVAGSLGGLPTAASRGTAFTANATDIDLPSNVVVSTDPPYYDNVGYADLSDFFYVWLRHSLRSEYPELFSTLTTPKDTELVATPQRHDGRESAELFFLDGMTKAMHSVAVRSHPSIPVTIYYAFKQTEVRSQGLRSTGWETFLQAVINAGFSISGTWPVRTERTGRMRDTGSNALASSIVIVCRVKLADSAIGTRREFLDNLKLQLPIAVKNLQKGGVAPVDIQQAAIGPGMAIFTRYSKVLDADGRPLAVRDALAIISEALDDVLTEQEGDFDAHSRWALTWFEQFGFGEGDYDTALKIARTRNVGVDGIVEAGIAIAKKGKVRLLKPEELPERWSPESDKWLTVWDTVQHLVRVLKQGEVQAAELLAKLGPRAEVARELAYRLYSICDRTKRSQDAQQYNELVQSWPEIVRLAQEQPKQAVQPDLFV